MVSIKTFIVRWCVVPVLVCLSTFFAPSFQQTASSRAASPPRDGSVRLVGGAHRAQGNVEIYHHTEWRPVCDDNWDMRSARVVCRQLGFLNAVEATSASEFGLTNVGGGGFGASSTKFWLDDVRCWGYERNLSSCMSAGWGHFDCQPNEAAGVICSHPLHGDVEASHSLPTDTTPAVHNPLENPLENPPVALQHHVNVLHSSPSFARAVGPLPATAVNNPRTTITTAKIVAPTAETNLTRTTRQFPLTPIVESIETALIEQDEDGPAADSRRIPESLQRLLNSLMSSGQIPTISSNGARLAPRFVSSSREQRPDTGSVVNRYEIQLTPQSDQSYSIPEPTPTRRQYVVSRPSSPSRAAIAVAIPQARSTSPTNPPALLPDPFAGVADDEPYTSFSGSGGGRASSSYSRPPATVQQQFQREPELIPENFFSSNAVEHSPAGDVIVRSRSAALPVVPSARSLYPTYTPNSDVTFADDAYNTVPATVAPSRQRSVDAGSDDSTSGMRKLRLLADNGRYSSTGGIVQYWDASRQFWRTVCGNGWTLREAEVVCRHINSGHAHTARHRPVQEIILAMESDKPLALSDPIVCAGSESNLYECRRASSDISGCSGSSFQSLIAASVECSSGSDLPDLVPEAQRLQSSMYLQRVPLYMLQCAMEEQCLSRSAYEAQQAPGMTYMWPYQTRNLLRFTLATKNIGTTDFRPHILKNMWEWHACHQHYHSMEVFAHYDVMDQSGRKVAEGHKASFCLEDNECEHDWQRKYACANYGDQGISAGCVDTYKADIDCQWVDMTDVQPGIYLLRVAINPDRKVAESSFDNNVVECQLNYYEQTVMAQNCHVKGLP